MKNMLGKLIHVIPFDIGYSFMDYMNNKQQTKENFCNKIKTMCWVKGYNYLESHLKNYLCVVQFKNEENMYKCYLLTYGVGVFVLENKLISDTTEADNYFEGYDVAKLYYRKKKEQKELLENMNLPILQDMSCIMEAVWEAVKKPMRPFSANKNYKHHGISYVLTIYDIKQIEQPDIKLLMNPDVMCNILDCSKWPIIKEALCEDRNIKEAPCEDRNIQFSSVEYGGEYRIAASWSAVAIIGNHLYKDIEPVINYEINLQAAWFLFDCLIDNVRESAINIVDLQNEKSIFTCVDLDISNIISANMKSSEKDYMQIIYDTSGINVLKQKLELLLKNKIAITEAKLAEKQKVYGIITEILLVVFTLVSIYEPIQNLIEKNIKKSDIIVLIIMLIALLCSTFFIVRKEK